MPQVVHSDILITPKRNNIKPYSIPNAPRKSRISNKSIRHLSPVPFENFILPKSQKCTNKHPISEDLDFYDSDIFSMSDSLSPGISPKKSSPSLLIMSKTKSHNSFEKSREICKNNINLSSYALNDCSTLIQRSYMDQINTLDISSLFK
ncbi:hypothetical protein BB561_001231 [Smittium simulii]|uniref:Uncharacterized protein n=1 Tax=Smittium simulii TaxID=133385 RepID=A0A2T9YVH9_9FUNG|nr:hypothetical protein BB561_001231 [Smittium simulii]